MNTRGFLAPAIALAGVLMVIPVTAFAQADACAGARDIRLTNGKIITMEPQNPTATEVTIQEGRFAYVGKTSAKLNPCTKVIDVKGRTVVPGLIDGHNHFIPLSLAAGHDVRLETAWTIPEILARISARTKTTPPGKFITSTAGWAVIQLAEKRMPTMAELDQAAPDNPVFIYPNGPGGAVVNSKGKVFFESKGIKINSDGTIPSGGGGFGGFSDEFGALRALQTFDELKERAMDAETYAVSLGMTANVDGGITYLQGTPDLYDATTTAPGMETFNPWIAYDPLLALNREGKLTARVRFYWYGQDTRPDVPLLKQHLLNTFPYFGDDMMRQSGIGERPVSWSTGGGGQRSTVPDNFETALMLIAQYRWSFIHHAISAQDSKMITETMERVNKVYPIADLRWSLLHTADISDDTLNRLKAMGAGVQPNAYPYISAVPPNATGPAGPPFRRILDNGIHVTGGSGCVGVCGLDPWLMIYYMVTGKNAAGQMKNAGNQITRMEALRLYTAAPPWFFHEEDKLGSMEPGKLGDVAVLSADYTDPGKVPDEEIRNLKSVLTIVGGKVVYNDLH